MVEIILFGPSIAKPSDTIGTQGMLVVLVLQMWGKFDLIVFKVALSHSVHLSQNGWS